MPSPGSSFGPYRIESRLGSGGMGVVFAATDTRLGRRVALKVVSANLAGDPEFATRFQHEAAILARLDSPHIVSIFEYGEHDGAAYITTQLVGGGDLGSLLRRRGPLPRQAAVGLVEQLAQALDDAHRSGVVHRDVKPANVLVRDPDASPLFALLCDFGIAQAGDLPGLIGQTATGTVAGSWAYLSPERLNGSPATPGSDIYALGCVLWACLTGAAPYTGSDLQVAQAHVGAPVRQLPGTENRHLNQVLARAMAKDPAQRFSSAGEFREALLREQEAPTSFAALPPATGTRPSTTPEQRTPPPRRRRGAMIGAIGALVLILGIGAAVWALVANDDGTAGTAGTADPTRGGTTTATDLDAPEDRKALLEETVADLFPAGTAGEAQARTWSVLPENIVDSAPRDLDLDEWDAATDWRVESTSPGYTVFLRVAHTPPDDQHALTASCEGVATDVSSCRLLTGADGTVGVETWFHVQGSTDMTHRVTIPGDIDSGRPEVSAGERIQHIPANAPLAKLRSETRIPGADLLEAIQDPDLLFPRPDPEPPLPSYWTCLLERQNPPSGCPDDLT